MSEKLSNESVRKLYSDLNFPGSYYGAHNFYKELIKKFGKEKVPSYQNLLNILKDIPTFQIHSLYKDKKYYRHMDNVNGQGISLQADLAFMPQHDEYTGFFLAVDEWNNFIYCFPFKNKSKNSIQNILHNLFKTPSLQNLTIISSDQGNEFKSNVKFAKEHNVKWLFLKSFQKAFLSEVYIKIVKGKLYRAMRDKKTTNWPNLLLKVVQSINNTYSSFLQMTPQEANTPQKDPEIRAKWERKLQNFRKTTSSET